MSSSIEKLQKFLKLEADRGYDNRAVFGGLGIIAKNWENEAKSENVDFEMIKIIVEHLRKYPTMDTDQRSSTVNKILSILHSVHKPHNIPSKFNNRPRARRPNRTEASQLATQGNKKFTKKIKSEPDDVEPEDQFPDPISGLESPLTVLQGIGNKSAEVYQKIGLNTLGDLLYYFPKRYDDYSQIKPINQLKYKDEVTVIATVQNVQSRRIRGGKSSITEAVVSDDTGYLRLTWFNQPYQEKRLNQGQQIVLSGKINMYLGRLVINNPEWEPIEKEHLHTNRIVPVYQLTNQLTQHSLRSTIFQTVNYWGARIPDYLPAFIKESQNLVSLSTAIINIHFPKTQELLQASHERLAFDELFLLQIGLFQQKYRWESTQAQIYSTQPDWLSSKINELPYRLTDAQKRVLEDIQKDLSSGHPMNRLLQGDVGSGKTVIAALSMLMITNHGAQTVLMAPTSILADQLYQNIKSLLTDSLQNTSIAPQEIRLLIGDTPETEKQDIRTNLENGNIKIVVGTHALIEEPVQFNNLQLVIIDEQHRFGVNQRASLREKGNNPHLMVMTATPIPRSMALTIYGDLDISVIDELPVGRKPVMTRVLHPLERERAYQLIISQIESGKQAFIIYPYVEQENEDANIAAVNEHARLQKNVFPKQTVGLLHGRMKQEEKDAIMKDFRDGAFQILISTSVIEVGVDIPNATVMLIEGANRFGLAQLHQLRGRVGRGSEQSYCLLIPETEDSIENERLQVMCQTNDGFILADRDLQHRGPGEFLGTRQSGFSEIKLASLTDYKLIENARNQAEKLFLMDPELKKEEHQTLQKMVQRFWKEGRGDVS